MTFNYRVLNSVVMCGLLAMVLSQSGCTNSLHILDQREHLPRYLGGSSNLGNADPLPSDVIELIGLPLDSITYFESIQWITVRGWMAQFEDEAEMWQNYERFKVKDHIFVDDNNIIEQIDIDGLGEAAFGFPIYTQEGLEGRDWIRRQSGNHLFFARCNTLVWISLSQETYSAFSESELVKYARRVDEAIQATLCAKVDG